MSDPRDLKPGETIAEYGVRRQAEATAALDAQKRAVLASKKEAANIRAARYRKKHHAICNERSKLAMREKRK